jgi:magnesium transporter
MSSTIPSSSAATPTSSGNPESDLQNFHDDLNPIVSFIIGFAIILGASIMNAGGLNLVKMDMVRSMALPRAQRKRDFLRPLWLIGMVLYITSQLIGSTLALEFIRAGAKSYDPCAQVLC